MVDFSKLIDEGKFASGRFFQGLNDEEARQVDIWLSQHIVNNVEWLNSPDQLDKDDNLKQAVKEFTSDGFVLFFKDPEYTESVGTITRCYILAKVIDEATIQVIDKVSFSLKTGNQVV